MDAGVSKAPCNSDRPRLCLIGRHVAFVPGPVAFEVQRGNTNMGTSQQARIDESNKPLRSRHPLAGCDQQTLIHLQNDWGMSEPLIFGPRLGSDAICLRADLTMGSALANLRSILVSNASIASAAAPASKIATVAPACAATAALASPSLVEPSSMTRPFTSPPTSS